MSEVDDKLIQYKTAFSKISANTVVLSGESKADFDVLLKGTRDMVKPADDVEVELVDQMVYAFWRVRRCREADSLFVEKHSSLMNASGRTIDWEKIFSSDFMDKLTRYEANALKQVSMLFETLAAYRHMQAANTIEANVDTAMNG